MAPQPSTVLLMTVLYCCRDFLGADSCLESCASRASLAPALLNPRVDRGLTKIADIKGKAPLPPAELRRAKYWHPSPREAASSFRFSHSSSTQLYPFSLVASARVSTRSSPPPQRFWATSCSLVRSRPCGVPAATRREKPSPDTWATYCNG